MMSCASPWLHTDGPRECSRCGPAHAPGCAFQILSFSRQGCHYGGLCLLSVTVLFMVLSKKAMWGHTRDACIRGTWVESEGGGGSPVVPHPVQHAWHQQAASKYDDRAHICHLKNVRADPLQTAQPGHTDQVVEENFYCSGTSSACSMSC